MSNAADGDDHLRESGRNVDLLFLSLPLLTTSTPLLSHPRILLPFTPHPLTHLLPSYTTPSVRLSVSLPLSIALSVWPDHPKTVCLPLQPSATIIEVEQEQQEASQGKRQLSNYSHSSVLVSAASLSSPHSRRLFRVSRKARALPFHAFFFTHAMIQGHADGPSALLFLSFLFSLYRLTSR